MNLSAVIRLKSRGTAILRHWFFVGIALTLALAFILPSGSVFLKKWKVLEIVIFIAFLITGFKLDIRSLVSDGKNLFTSATAILSIFVLFPLSSFLLAKIFFADSPEFIVGICIIAVAPVTVASGLVMTMNAGGNVSLALLICVISNFLCILTIPPSLEFLLSFGEIIKLPVLEMIMKLVYIVVLPIVVGQILMLKFKKTLLRWDKAFSVFSQIVVLIIIFNAVSGSLIKMERAGGWELAGIAVFIIALHSLYLLANNGLAHILKLDHASRAAFTIQTSQKTLTVSYVVWSGWFATAYPLAMTPAIIYHLTQMLMDTVVSHKFRRKIK